MSEGKDVPLRAVRLVATAAVMGFLLFAFTASLFEWLPRLMGVGSLYELLPVQAVAPVFAAVHLVMTLVTWGFVLKKHGVVLKKKTDAPIGSRR